MTKEEFKNLKPKDKFLYNNIEYTVSEAITDSNGDFVIVTYQKEKTKRIWMDSSTTVENLTKIDTEENPIVSVPLTQHQIHILKKLCWERHLLLHLHKKEYELAPTKFISIDKETDDLIKLLQSYEEE